MNKIFEYYRVHRKADGTIPLLDSDKGNPNYLYEDNIIENPKLMLFRLGNPLPRKPKMADYHSTPNSVISKKIFSVLSRLKIEGIQLLPARIRGFNDEIFKDYWAVHVYNHIQCINSELSDCRIENSSLEYVKRLVLNQKILEAIPIEKRLIFRLKEDFAYQLYHVSIVEAIMAVNPDGIGFTNIGEWDEGSLFKKINQK